MALNFAQPSDAGPAPILIHPEDGRPVTIPEAGLLFGADFIRDGSDLVLRNADAPDIRIVDYFDGSPADLSAPDGAVIRGGSVARLAGPEAPGQYAQAGAQPQGDPIGQVESLSGEASVQRADGTVETLRDGSVIFLDDVLRTGADGKLSVTFVDGTIFTLTGASRMIVDTLIYDPAAQDNFGSFDLIQGGFVFIAGQVAKTGGMDVATPAATMGIRGTTVLVDVQTEDGVATAQVTLVRDPDGDVGRVELSDLSQNLIATITEANASWVISAADGETREVAQGTAPDAADTLLIAEAIAAYQAAFARVGQGGSFVELDNVLRGAAPGVSEGDGEGIDLDSDDADDLPELAPPPSVPDGGSDSFDEGRNGALRPDAPDIVVTGLEDAAEGEAIAGDLAGEEGTSFAIVSGPSRGSVTLSPDGSFVYVPVADFNGTDDFVYTVTGRDGTKATGTVTVRVLPVNDAPEATGGTVTTAEDRIVTGTTSAVDVDGDRLTFGIAEGAAHGRVVVTADGAWAYTPDPDFAGTDSFAVRVTDPSGAAAIATYLVVIAGRPDAPVSATPPDQARGDVVESTGALAGGVLTATDADPGAILTWSGSAAGAYGTFNVAPDGTWTYAAGPAAENLASGQSATESFTATVTDETGLTGTQTVMVTITGANDAPVSSAGDAGTTKGTPVSGLLVASDIDATDVLTFAPGPKSAASGTVAIEPDGRFTYTPAEGFQGLDSFDYTVTDGQGGASTSRVTVAVVSPSASGSGGSSVSLGIVADPGEVPAGTVLSTATPVDATGVNLVVALDRSGSIGAAEWSVQINQVADALELLADRFAGAATSVDVRVVAYSATATATPTFDLTDPALIDTVRSLPFTGGTTNYTAALGLAEAFFDAQPTGEANFLYFITDGGPTDATWPDVLDRLTDGKDYTVRVEAFGIGSSIDFDTLSLFDPTPEVVADAGDLAAAFTATPLFSASLVSLSVGLVADGIDRGEIATDASPGIVSGGLVTSLPLAEIAGLADLLGDTNRISATAGYDLDGDPATIEVELFASELFGKAGSPQALSGSTGSDLLFGSDGADDLTGGPGNDVILAFGGDDVIRPGSGIDTVLAGGGDDRIVVASAESGPGGERLDGGEGRDTLDIDFGGNVNDGLLDLVDLRGIEVIDMENGQANTLRLTLSDVLGMSEETDTTLEALLGAAVPDARTILGDATDSLVLEGAEKTGSVADGAGRTLDIYAFAAGSDVLATLAVDADIAVTTQAAGA